MNNFLAYDNGAAVLGEHTNISSNYGEVDLYFRNLPVITYTTPDTFDIDVAINNLSPTNTGGTPTSYSVSPALPAGLQLNASTGVISGTPTASSMATNYTVTATNAGGNGTFNINITVDGQYSFHVSSDSSTGTYFNITINGANYGGGRVDSNNLDNLVGYLNIVSNSTVVMQVTMGYMPTSAELIGNFGSINGVISGSKITFSNVNLPAGTSCSLAIF